jgi:hypothetical protein
MITEPQIVLRLFLTAVLGGLVGLEREAIAKVPGQPDMDRLIGRLSHVQGVRAFEIQ